MGAQRLFHRIAEQLTELIETGVYPPGSRLPGERELAEKFDVSRVTIREAEIALQAIGRLEIKTGAGVYVSEEQPVHQSTLPDVSAFEVTEARSLVESEAAALAAKQISDEDLAKLISLVDDMVSDDEGVSNEADGQFHALIARASGNGALLHTIESYWRMREEIPEVKRSYSMLCESDTKARAREHQEILDALLARDPSRAREAMRKHFHRMISTMLDLTEREAIRELQEKTTRSRKRFLTDAKI